MCARTPNRRAALSWCRYVENGVLSCSTICPGATTILRTFEEGEQLFEDPNLKVQWTVSPTRTLTLTLTHAP